MMFVYHGSYTVVDKPDLTFSRDMLDFGKGFYVTPIRSQAVSWAMRWKRRHRQAIVNCYRFAEEVLAMAGVQAKIYPEYNAEWLHFIAANRDGRICAQYDIIQGGIANDKVFNTLELYFGKLITEEEALLRLKYEKPNIQICIRSQDLIDRFLKFDSAEEIIDGSR